MGGTSTIGQFSNTVTDLSEGTTYYYRAYAENDIGTNFGEVRSFTTSIILHASFSLSGATDGEQSGVIYSGGSHTYNVPLTHERAYNLTVNANSNLLDNLSIYESTHTNDLYIQASPFSITIPGTSFGGGVSPITITFSGTNSGRRYLVLPLTNTNHRLVISNNNAGTESYTLILAEEAGTDAIPVGRLLVNETPVGFFTNNEPELYWVHIPPNITNFDTSLIAFNSNLTTACPFVVGMDNINPSSINTYISSPVSSGYTIFRFLNANNNTINYRGCQYKFRFR